MKRSSIINHLIERNQYKRYLEIGIRNAKNFKAIKVPHKDGVDPAGNCNFKMTSDEFFDALDSDVKYDLIFIDGLHLKDQVLRDVDNSLAHLNDNGILVLHDCNPEKEEWAGPKQKVSKWTGTVWQAILHLRTTREDLDIKVVDADFGCGLIKPGHQILLRSDDLSWNAFSSNRKEYLNLITAKEFLEIY
jgi:hypothetical protein